VGEKDHESELAQRAPKKKIGYPFTLLVLPAIVNNSWWMDSHDAGDQLVVLNTGNLEEPCVEDMTSLIFIA
jgi:hypothetical protein